MKNELVRINNNQGMTIKSIELVEIINKFREMEGGKSELRHSDFMTKVRKEIEVLKNNGINGELNFNESIYLDKQGKVRPCYELTKEGVKYIIDTTKNTDRIPLQRAYEKMGGDYSKVICIDRFETTFLNKLNDTLKVLNIELETQKPILNYRLDAYIKECNLAVEYDEAQHFIEPQKTQDVMRQQKIKDRLGCKFIRCSYKNTDAYNIGLVVKEVIKKMA